MRAEARSKRGLGFSVLILGGLVATLASVAVLLPPPDRAEAECTADICVPMQFVTDQNGTYLLIITPFMVEATLPPALHDCVWDVEAQFGDGSPAEEYTFDATKSFSASHQFSEPGVYLVVVHARNGVQADTLEPCPSIQIDATVIYPEPPLPPPPPPDPPPDPPDPPAPGPVGSPGPTSSPAAVDAPLGSTDSGASEQAGAYWRDCGRVLAHALGCAKAARVARRARSILSRARKGRFAAPPAFRVLGFSCRVRHDAALPLACRRGERRLLAPLGSPEVAGRPRRG
jgi:hypothetical protein